MRGDAALESGVNQNFLGFSLVIALLSATVAGLAFARTLAITGRNQSRHTRVRIEPDPSEVELQGVKPLLVQRADGHPGQSVASVVIGQALPSASCASLSHEGLSKVELSPTD